jgi:hypothetical protein
MLNACETWPTEGLLTDLGRIRDEAVQTTILLGGEIEQTTLLACNSLGGETLLLGLSLKDTLPLVDGATSGRTTFISDALVREATVRFPGGVVGGSTSREGL